MAFALDKKHIGHQFKPFSTVVEAGKIRLFCKAIGEDNPIHHDKKAAQAAGYRTIVAPPTFATAVTNDDPEKDALLALINVDIGWILHGEQHYEYFAPICVGDRLTCQGKVTDIYDKKGGALWFVGSETEIKNDAGKLVAKAKSVTVVRNPEMAGKAA